MNTIFRIMHQKHACTHRGFTMIETLVSIALFSIVAVMAVGALTSIIDANRKARTQKVVTNNIYAAAEKMTRDIREGQGIDTANCGVNSCTFTDRESNVVTYSLNGTVIERNGVAITAPSLSIDDLTFTQLSQSGNQQPAALVTLKGTANTGTGEATEFNIETVISERVLDFGNRQVSTKSTATPQAGAPAAAAGVVGANTTQPKAGGAVPPAGQQVTALSDNNFCPWSGAALPPGYKLIDLMHGKGGELGFHFPHMKIWSGWSNLYLRMRACVPKQENIRIEECDLTDGNYVAATLLRFEANPAISALSRTIRGITTATCQMVDLVAGGAALGGIDVSGAYDVYLASDDEGHCERIDKNVIGVDDHPDDGYKGWSGDDCVSPKAGNKEAPIVFSNDGDTDPFECYCGGRDDNPATDGTPTTQNFNIGDLQAEKARVVFRDAAAAALWTSGYSTDIADGSAGLYTDVGTVDFGAGVTTIDMVDIELEHLNMWRDHGPGYPNYNPTPDLGCPVPPELPPDQYTQPQIDTYYTTADNPTGNTSQSMGVSCVLLAPSGSTPQVGGGACPPVAKPTYTVQCGNNCMPPGKKCCFDDGNPATNDPLDDENYWCEVGEQCGYDLGGIESCIASCGAGETFCGVVGDPNSICIPAAAAAPVDCCPQLDGTYRYCDNGAQCSPDGQCFVGGGTDTSGEGQGLGGQEF